MASNRNHPWRKAVPLPTKERNRLRAQAARDSRPASRPAPQLCELCGELPDSRGMCYDHDHATGLFRGWLCSRCNTALGMLGDTVARIERALSYLRRNTP